MPDTPSASVPSSPPRSPSNGFRLIDLLRFEKMLTPRLARLGFYVLSALAILAGVILIFSGMNARFGGGMRVVAGLVTTVVGPFLVCIACEQIIVIFGIYERLGEIRDQSRKAQHAKSRPLPFSPISPALSCTDCSASSS